jgi:hypothetical protein
MTRLLLFFFIVFCIYKPISAQNIIEACKFGQPLIDALQTDYTPSNPLGYGPARDILYSQIDNNGNDLSGIYTDFTVTLDPNDDPSQSAFQNGLNAEHVFPQSLGAGEEPRKSDLHNIFPSKVNVNESRGNCPFGEIEDSDTDKWFYLAIQSNNIPDSDVDSYSEKDEEDCVFEPREVVKGDIARAVFYFYAIYQTSANDNFFNQQKDILYQWHTLDPVDSKESQRNLLIAAQQGNENPFISDSTLVRRAFFEADADYPEGDINCYSTVTSTAEVGAPAWVKLVSNVIEEELILRTNETDGKVLLIRINGQVMTQIDLSPDTKIDMRNFPPGIYICQVIAGSKMQSFKIYKR